MQGIILITFVLLMWGVGAGIWGGLIILKSTETFDVILSALLFLNSTIALGVIALGGSIASDLDNIGRSIRGEPTLRDIIRGERRFTKTGS